jgi:predicted RNA-binding Zn ribbon-like protein
MVNSELITEFVNTRHIHVDRDEESLVDPAALAEWFAARGLVDARERASAAELRDALELREAIRTLLLANNGVEADSAAAAATLDEVARRSRIELRFAPGGSELVSGVTGVGGALGAVVLAAHGSMADGSWSLLKACRARDCEWAFLDQSKNHSRAWCSMESCGNREKARAHRARGRAAAT